MRCSPRAFTLLEVLIVAAMIGILMALLSPTLARVKHASRRAASLVNIRTHATAITMYCGDFREVFPFLTDPDATYSVLRCGERAQQAEYFWLSFLWHLGLADRYYEGVCDSPVFWPPGIRSSAATSYLYSPTSFAAPEYWNPLTRIGPSQWRAVRQAEVLFPSRKGILWNRAASPGLTLEYPIGLPEAGFIDGSAGVYESVRFLTPYQNGEGSFPGSYFSGYGLPVLHTIDGVRGRDLP
ncbi:MAG: hypothetical protein HBSAPP03_17350 [Phycisphaerae bacterium]|nr:MAG: hypothetical protein HBSAPP03_17350 [Phycisphaerae bacterium]